LSCQLVFHNTYKRGNALLNRQDGSHDGEQVRGNSQAQINSLAHPLNSLWRLTTLSLSLPSPHLSFLSDNTASVGRGGGSRRGRILKEKSHIDETRSPEQMKHLTLAPKDLAHGEP